MENFFLSPGGSGLWNNPRPPRYSKEAEDMRKLRREEASLTCTLRKQCNRYTELSSASDFEISSVSESDQQCKPRFQKRNAEACRAGRSYEREKFYPGPRKDLEEEKRKLQNIMARGSYKEPTNRSPEKNLQCCKPDQSEKIDRNEEVLNEIEERRQFLADMAALGQEQQYVHLINAEISQRVHELDVMNKAGSSREQTTEYHSRDTEH